MVPQPIKDIFMTIKDISSIILGIVPVAIAVYLFFENRKLKRLGNEQALQLKETELRHLEQPYTLNIGGSGGPKDITDYHSSKLEEARKREKLETEISYYKKLLGKKDL